MNDNIAIIIGVNFGAIYHVINIADKKTITLGRKNSIYLYLHMILRRTIILLTLLSVKSIKSYLLNQHA
jgi:hypothetical protein